jgi:RecA-family ATPase
MLSKRFIELSVACTLCLKSTEFLVKWSIHETFHENHSIHERTEFLQTINDINAKFRVDLSLARELKKK